MTTTQADQLRWDEYTGSIHRKTFRIVLFCALGTLAAMVIVVAVAVGLPGQDGFTMDDLRPGLGLVLSLGCFAISLAFISATWPVSLQMRAVVNGDREVRRAVHRAVMRGGDAGFSPEQAQQAWALRSRSLSSSWGLCCFPSSGGRGGARNGMPPKRSRADA